MKSIRLNTAQASELADLLGDYSREVASTIAGDIVPGTNEPNPHDSAAVENVAIDRALLKRLRQWRQYLLTGGLAR